MKKYLPVDKPNNGIIVQLQEGDFIHEHTLARVTNKLRGYSISFLLVPVSCKELFQNTYVYIHLASDGEVIFY